MCMPQILKEAHVSQKQCCGSVTFWNGSGSADSCLWPIDLDPDPDPALLFWAQMALASLVPFQGPKKSRFSGPTPSNAPRNDVARLKTIMYRAIKTTGTLIVICYCQMQVHAEDDEPMLEFEADSDPEQDNSEGRRSDDQCCKRQASTPITYLLVLLEVSPSRPVGACWRHCWWMWAAFSSRSSSLQCCVLYFVVLLFVRFFSLFLCLHLPYIQTFFSIFLNCCTFLATRISSLS
jgi:hypothetical protein